MRHNRVLGLVALLLLLATMPVVAQETTAAIQGDVTDASGAALPGVTVEAMNVKGQRYTTVSDAQGHYRFPAVPSGVYNITATLAGMEPATVRNLEVRLGTSPKVDLQMRLGALAETVTVTAEAPLVDVTQSSTSVSIAREQIELIPKGRDFTSVVTQAAGASNEAFLGGISIDGASGAENRYVIDGIDTTHPRNGVSAQDVITDFVEEVQVKTAGYAAEFGGSLGGVINAVTKSGSNQFNGSVLGYLTDSSWGGDPRPTYYPSDPTRYRTFENDDNQLFEMGVTLGGPVMRDRMWFFLGYNPQFQEINRTPAGSSTTYTQEVNQQYLVGNLTGNLGSKFVFRGSVNINPYEREGVLPALDNSTPAAADLSVNREIPTNSWSLHGDYVPTNNLAFNVRYGQFSTDINDSGLDVNSQFWFVGPNTPPVPQSDPRYRPAGFLSVPTFFQTERDKWDRQSAAVSATYFVNAFGSHEFKGGVQLENIKNDVLNQEVGNHFRIRWNTARLGVVGDYGSVEVRRFQTIGSAESENTGLFLQDSWQVVPNLILNLGVRAEEEKVPNYPVNVPDYGQYAFKFDFADKFAPRLGFAWDVFGNQKMRAYGSWGKYYDITKLAMPRGSFGADRWIAYIYPLNTLDWETLDDSCHTSTNNPADNPCPGLGTPGTTRDFRRPTNPAEAIDPDLKPMSQREWQLGADYSLTTRSMFGVRYVDKKLLDTIEDIGFLVESAPGSGVFDEHYITGNPGKGLVAGDPEGPVPGQPEAVRDYKALELSYNRRFVDNWSVRASYTYSKLEGNYSGLASSDEFGRNDPNIERYFDSLINGYDDQGNLVLGPLNTDRPHAVEVQGLYRIPFGTTFGVSSSWRSGTPVSEEAFWFGVPYFPNGRGNLGRTPSLSQTDLLITQPFTVRNFTLEASLNVLNLFDQDTVTRIGNNHWVEDVCEDVIEATVAGGCDHTYEQFFNGVPFDTNKLMDEGGAQTHPSFNRPLAFQAGRQVRVGLRFIF